MVEHGVATQRAGSTPAEPTRPTHQVERYMTVHRPNAWAPSLARVPSASGRHFTPRPLTRTALSGTAGSRRGFRLTATSCRSTPAQAPRASKKGGPARTCRTHLDGGDKPTQHNAPGYATRTPRTPPPSTPPTDAQGYLQGIFQPHQRPRRQHRRQSSHSQRDSRCEDQMSSPHCIPRWSIWPYRNLDRSDARPAPSRKSPCS